MLVLVAGVTGNMGQKLVHSLVSKGHQVRGLSRNASKLPPETHSLLEDFVCCSTFYDIAALDRACSGGVDAVICAYAIDPRLQLEGQLLLLQACERAGIRRYVAASWNHDWRDLPLPMHETYDAYVSFRHHVELTSDIKPIYIFVGVFAETMFSMPDHGNVHSHEANMWDPVGKRFKIWGTGHEVWYWTTEKDAAEFTVRILERDDAAEGGFWNVCSGALSLREVARVYEQVRGVNIAIDVKGGVEELRAKALDARKTHGRANFNSYIYWFYQLRVVDGTFYFRRLDNDKLDVKTTTLVEFLTENESI